MTPAPTSLPTRLLTPPVRCSRPPETDTWSPLRGGVPFGVSYLPHSADSGPSKFSTASGSPQNDDEFGLVLTPADRDGDGARGGPAETVAAGPRSSAPMPADAAGPGDAGT